MNYSSKHKTLVFLTSRFPYPLEKGDKLRAYHQIKHLSSLYNIVLVSLSESKINEAQKKQLSVFCSEVHVIHLSKFQKYLGVLKAILSEKPFQVGYFFNYSIQHKINKILKKTKPDFIFCQLIRVAEYVKSYHECPKMIDYMDALSLGMERRSKLEKGIKKILFEKEGIRLQKYEHHVFDFFEKHLIISEQDKVHILHKNQQNIHVVPNGVDATFFSPKSTKKNYDIVFTGNMSYAPNINAAQFIVNEILPLLPETTSVLIAGANPSNEVLGLKSKRVNISGWVNDIRDSYYDAKIFVAPMFLGTGLQNKLLEAMATGTPCITTTLANNALAAIPEHDILIAQDAESFSQQIKELLTYDKKRNELAENGRKFILANYSWETTNENLKKIIGLQI